MILDILLDALLDTLKLLPFLFLTYLAMEYIEHKMSDKAVSLVNKAGHFGPVLGGALGLVPQCGFSVTASNFYAGRLISIGTLIWVFTCVRRRVIPRTLAKPSWNCPRPYWNSSTPASLPDVKESVAL